MNKMQELLLDMVKWFHAFCTKHNLRYYVLGGTCLGAVRHKGFIPWDDDIDVGMPRVDYDKLIALLPKAEQTKYRFEFPLQNKDFVYTFGKLYDTETTLIENVRYRPKRGIYIDIFPLDGAGDTLEESEKRFRSIDNMIALHHTKVCAIASRRAWYKNLAIVLSRCIPSFILDWRKYQTQIIKKASELSFDDCDYVANYFGAWHLREISKREWFGEPKLYQFEGIEVYGPANADAYLSKMYGDYMKLPPEEKRVSHHDYVFIDLNKGYLE